MGGPLTPPASRHLARTSAARQRGGLPGAGLRKGCALRPGVRARRRREQSSGYGVYYYVRFVRIIRNQYRSVYNNIPRGGTVVRMHRMLECPRFISPAADAHGGG